MKIEMFQRTSQPINCGSSLVGRILGKHFFKCRISAGTLVVIFTVAGINWIAFYDTVK